ncbi:MAG: hypothetical protein ACM31I_08840 [Deltaproteobacteria bacterium]
MSVVDIILVAVVAGIAFVSCFVHALRSDIAERRGRDLPVR